MSGRAPQNPTPQRVDLRQRLYRCGKGLLQRLYDRAIHTGPVLPIKRYFPAHAELSRLTPLLQEQSRALLPHVDALPRFHELSSTQGRFAYRDGRRWSVLPLRIYGVNLPANQQRLPALTPFLRAHPEVTGAMVSCLESDKHIRPHRGPFRGVMRYHLTLHCASGDPDHDCRLRVADRWFPYREGEALLWDDTFEHEVRNRTDSDRIALLLDIRRPELPLHLVLLSTCVIKGVGLYCRLRQRRYRVAPATAPSP